MIAFSTTVSYSVEIRLDSQLGYQLLHIFQLFLLPLQISLHTYLKYPTVNSHICILVVSNIIFSWQ